MKINHEEKSKKKLFLKPSYRETGKTLPVFPLTPEKEKPAVDCQIWGTWMWFRVCWDYELRKAVLWFLMGECAQRACLSEDGRCRVSVGILFLSMVLSRVKAKSIWVWQILLMCGCYSGLENDRFRVDCYKALWEQRGLVTWPASF